MRKLFLSLTLVFMLITLIGIGSAFTLEKSLVQLETDENYPCHIENGNEIVCPPIDNIKITEWKSKIDNLKSEEKDKGKLTDKNKKSYLDEKIVPYDSVKMSKVIQIDKEYREKINIYSMKDDDTIKIGFNTNIFGLGSTPLENFDTNYTTGLIRYRPLNMTWLNLPSGYISGYTFTNYNITRSSIFCSLWFNTSTSATTKQILRYGASGELTMGTKNSTSIYAQIVNSSSNGYKLNVTLDLPISLNDSLWHNVVLTYEPTQSNLSIYLDNTYTNSNNFSYDRASLWSSPNVNIGGFSSPFTGGIANIDEVRCYINKTLPTITELTAIYNSGRISNKSLYQPSTLIDSLWYNFNQNQGTTVYDIFGRYNGTISSGTWQSDNINVSTLGYNVNINLVNITNAFVYWDNGTLINQSFTGNTTYTFYNNQSIYVLENFPLNITEGVSPLKYYPFNLTLNTSTNKHISSAIDSLINVSMYINVDKCDIKSIAVTPKSLPFYTPVYTCSGTKMMIYNVTLAKSATSNEINISYNYPSVSIVYPTNNGRYNRADYSSLNLTYSSNDTDACWYSINNGITNSSSVSAGTNFTDVFLSNSNNWIVYCNSSSGAIASNSVSFTTYLGVPDSSCSSALDAFQSYPVLVGLIGTVFLMGFAILFIGGYSVISSGQEITGEQVGVFFLTLIGMGVLIIIGIIAIVSVCSLGVI